MLREEKQTAKKRKHPKAKLYKQNPGRNRESSQNKSFSREGRGGKGGMKEGMATEKKVKKRTGEDKTPDVRKQEKERKDRQQSWTPPEGWLLFSCPIPRFSTLSPIESRTMQETRGSPLDHSCKTSTKHWITVSHYACP